MAADRGSAEQEQDPTLVAMDLVMDLGVPAASTPVTQPSANSSVPPKPRVAETKTKIEESPELLEIEAPVEIEQPSIEERKKARLDAAWRDMEEKRYEYERMEQEKREGTKKAARRSLLMGLLAVAILISLWQLWQMFAPPPAPKSAPMVAKVALPPAAIPKPVDPRGTEDFNEGNKLFNSQDFIKAAEFFKKAADQGNTEAQTNLGTMYAEGKGVVQDYQQSMSWYIKAAEQGAGESLTHLGAMYAEGKGVPPDSVEADKWLSLADASGKADAKKRREEIEKTMTPEQLTAAKQRVDEWKKAHPALSPTP